MSAFDIVGRLNIQSVNVGSIRNQLNNQLKNLTATVDLKIAPNSQRAADSLTGSLHNLNAALERTAELSAKVRAALTVFSSTQSTVASKAGKTSSALNQQGEATRRVTKETKSAKEGMEDFGKASGLALRRFSAFTLAAGTLGTMIYTMRNATKTAFEFQHSMLQLVQVTGNSIASIRSIENEIGRLSKGFGVSSTELSTAARTLSQAGLSADQVRQSLQALAKTDLSPTFDSITDTTEGVVAAFQQFNLSAKTLEKTLGSINSVSAAFAVESSDIITAIKRTGGAFEAAGGSLNELMALFTSVRHTTRESAETIATGFRTIFTRLQRKSTGNFLEQLGIQVRDLNGQFIGPMKAIEALSNALQSIPSESPIFSEIVEELGGFRQISKVIPLIRQYETAQRALGVARAGQISLDKDAIISQDSLIRQAERVRETFLELFRSIADNTMFKTLIRMTLDTANAFLGLAKAVEPMIPGLLLLGGISTMRTGTRFARGFVRGFTGRTDEDEQEDIFGIFRKADRDKHGISGSKHPLIVEANTRAIQSLTVAINALISQTGGVAPRTKFATGGLVPGTGNRDTVPAYLTPGEFVVRKKAVESLGVDTLAELNESGVRKFATGGHNPPPKPRRRPKTFIYVWDDKAGKINPTTGEPEGAQKKVYIRGKSFKNIFKNAQDQSAFLDMTGNPAIPSTFPSGPLKDLDVLGLKDDTLRFNALEAVRDDKKHFSKQKRTAGIGLRPERPGDRPLKTYGLAILNPPGISTSMISTLALRDMNSSLVSNADARIVLESPREAVSKYFADKIQSGLRAAIVDTAKDVGQQFNVTTNPNFPDAVVQQAIEDAQLNRITGNVFEGVIRVLSEEVSAGDANKQFDFPTGLPGRLRNIFPRLSALPRGIQTEVKTTANRNTMETDNNSILSKIQRDMAGINVKADVKKQKQQLARVIPNEAFREAISRIQERTDAPRRPRSGGRAQFSASNDFYKLFGLNSGGKLPGYGTRDTIPAMLTPGEYVINANAVKKLGVPFLNQVNQGKIPGFNKGGIVQQKKTNIDEIIFRINKHRALATELEQKIQEHVQSRPDGGWKPTVSKWKNEIQQLQSWITTDEARLKHAVEKEHGTTLDAIAASKRHDISIREKAIQSHQANVDAGTKQLNPGFMKSQQNIVRSRQSELQEIDTYHANKRAEHLAKASANLQVVELPPPEMDPYYGPPTKQEAELRESPYFHKDMLKNAAVFPDSMRPEVLNNLIRNARNAQILATPADPTDYTLRLQQARIRREQRIREARMEGKSNKGDLVDRHGNLAILNPELDMGVNSAIMAQHLNQGGLNLQSLASPFPASQVMTGRALAEQAQGKSILATLQKALTGVSITPGSSLNPDNLGQTPHPMSPFHAPPPPSPFVVDPVLDAATKSLTPEQREHFRKIPKQHRAKAIKSFYNQQQHRKSITQQRNTQRKQLRSIYGGLPKKYQNQILQHPNDVSVHRLPLALSEAEALRKQYVSEVGTDFNKLSDAEKAAIQQLPPNQRNKAIQVRARLHDRRQAQDTRAARQAAEKAKLAQTESEIQRYAGIVPPEYAAGIATPITRDQQSLDNVLQQYKDAEAKHAGQLDSDFNWLSDRNKRAVVNLPIDKHREGIKTYTQITGQLAGGDPLSDEQKDYVDSLPLDQRLKTSLDLQKLNKDMASITPSLSDKQKGYIDSLPMDQRVAKGIELQKLNQQLASVKSAVSEEDFKKLEDFGLTTTGASKAAGVLRQSGYKWQQPVSTADASQVYQSLYDEGIADTVGGSSPLQPPAKQSIDLASAVYTSTQTKGKVVRKSKIADIAKGLFGRGPGPTLTPEQRAIEDRDFEQFFAEHQGERIFNLDQQRKRLEGAKAAQQLSDSERKSLAIGKALKSGSGNFQISAQDAQEIFTPEQIAKISAEHKEQAELRGITGEEEQKELLRRLFQEEVQAQNKVIQARVKAGAKTEAQLAEQVELGEQQLAQDKTILRSKFGEAKAAERAQKAQARRQKLLRGMAVAPGLIQSGLFFAGGAISQMLGEGVTENTVLKGNQSTLDRAKMSEGISGAVAGASLGSSVGTLVAGIPVIGPIAAMVGTLGGAVLGAVNAFDEADKKIRSIKLDDSMNKFNAVVARLVDGTASLSETVGQFNQMAHNLRAVLEGSASLDLNQTSGTMDWFKSQLSGLMSGNSVLGKIAQYSGLNMLMSAVPASLIGANSDMSIADEAAFAVEQSRIADRISERRAELSRMSDTSNNIRTLAQEMAKSIIKTRGTGNIAQTRESFLAQTQSMRENISNIENVSIGEVTKQLLQSFDDEVKKINISNEVQQVNIATRQSVKEMRDLSSTVKLVTSDMLAMSESLSALSIIFGGNISLQERGFTGLQEFGGINTANFERDARNIFGGLSGGDRFSKELIELNRIESILPKIIETVARSGATVSTEDISSVLLDRLEPLIDVTGPVARTLSASLREMTAVDFRQRALDDPSALVKELLQSFSPLVDLANDLSQSFTDAVNRFYETQSAISQQESAILAERMKLPDMRLQLQELVAARDGGETTLADRQRPFETRQMLLSPNGLDVNALGDSIVAKSNRIEELRRNMDTARDNAVPGERNAAIKSQAIALKELERQVNNDVQALKNLADSAEQAAVLQDELNKEMQRAKTLQNAGRTLAFGSASDRRELGKVLSAGLKTVAQGSLQGMSEMERADAGKFFDQFGGLRARGMGNQEIGGKILEGVLAQELGPFGDFLSGELSPQGKNLQNDLIAVQRKSIEAQVKLEQTMSILNEQLKSRASTMLDDRFREVNTQNLRNQLLDNQNQITSLEAAKTSQQEGFNRVQGLFPAFNIGNSGQLRELHRASNMTASFVELSEVQDKQGLLGRNYNKIQSLLSNVHYAESMSTDDIEKNRNELSALSGVRPDDALRVIQELRALRDVNEGASPVGLRDLTQKFITEQSANLATQHQEITDTIRRAGVSITTINQILNTIPAEKLHTSFSALSTVFKDAQDPLETYQKTIRGINKEIESLQKDRATKEKELEAAQAKARGGIIYANQGMFVPRGTDTVPAMLTPGEFVVRREQAQKHMGLLKRINAGGTVYAQDGGLINDIMKNGRFKRLTSREIFELKKQGVSPQELRKLRDKIYENRSRENLGYLRDTFERQIGMAHGARASRLSDIKARVKENRATARDSRIERRAKLADVQFNSQMAQEQKWRDSVRVQDDIQFNRRRLADERRARLNRIKAEIADRRGVPVEAPPVEAPVQVATPIVAPAVTTKANKPAYKTHPKDEYNPFDPHQNPAYTFYDRRAKDSISTPPFGGSDLQNRDPNTFFGIPKPLTFSPPKEVAQRDSIHSTLTKGEFVVNRGGVNRAGRRRLERLNRGYQSGGVVGDASGSGMATGENNEELTRALLTFSGSADKLTTALNSFPREIMISSSQTVNVNINGAEVIAQFNNDMQRIALETTREQIDQMLRDKFPETGGLL